MKDYFLKHYKIYISIIVSFILVIYILPIFYTPGKLTKSFNNFTSFFKNENLFSFLSAKNSKKSDSSNNQSQGTFYFPTPGPTIYTPTPGILSPTPNLFISPSVYLTPTKVLTITSTILPTATKVPKPTKPPDVFPIDPSLVRPGKTTNEVFSYASQKTCVPEAVLKGIAYIESGSFFDVVSPKYFLLYNSWNWWKSPYLTDVKRACGGYDYASNTGIIPDDSNFAGEVCPGAQGGNLVCMGPLSVSDYWEGRYKPEAAKLLGVSSVDQRVILDSIVIVGISLKTNVKPANCKSWSAWEVAKAACSYYGSCGFKDGTYYCNTFCRNYKNFGGKGDCQAAVNKMQDNCWQASQ